MFIAPHRNVVIKTLTAARLEVEGITQFTPLLWYLAHFPWHFTQELPRNFDPDMSEMTFFLGLFDVNAEYEASERWRQQR